MINVTPAAASKISELLTEENKTEAGLRVFVQGGGCSGFQYGLMIDEGEGDATTDAVIESHGVKLLVDPSARATCAAPRSTSSTTSPAADSPSRIPTPNRRAAAARRSASSALIDLHLHTTASDGALAPPDLVCRAAAAGLSIISITDHDTISGLAEGREAALHDGLELIAGIEISAVADGRDLHLLGYFFDPASPPLSAFLIEQRRERLRRVEEMGAKLADLGKPIDVAPILDAAERGKSVGRPQVAVALVAAGHVRSRDEAFRSLLEPGGPVHVPRRGATPEAVIALLHSGRRPRLDRPSRPEPPRRGDRLAGGGRPRRDRSAAFRSRSTGRASLPGSRRAPRPARDRRLGFS